MKIISNQKQDSAKIQSIRGTNTDALTPGRSSGVQRGGRCSAASSKNPLSFEVLGKRLGF